MEVKLLDSAGKKIRFIRHVVRELKLANIQTLQQRAEALEEGTVFANITSRAFSSLQAFAEAARPAADASSQLLAMKGAHPTPELEDLADWVNVQSVEELTVPYLHAERHLVIMTISA